jgi:outer membrane lipoprotein-sorting protein
MGETGFAEVSFIGTPVALRSGVKYQTSKLLHVSLWQILGVVVSLSLPTVTVPSPQLLTGILAKMEAARRNLKSLQATIITQHTNVQIGSVDTEQGTILYKPNGSGKGKLRIDYTKPDTRAVAIIGDEVVLYQPRINQVLKTKLAQATKGRTGGFTQLVALDSSIKSLTTDYRIEYVSDETINGQAAAHLRLVPLKSSSLVSLEIYVSQQTWLPLQYRFTERNGDFSVVSLSHMQLNLSVPDERFIVRYPSNTAVISKLEE